MSAGDYYPSKALTETERSVLSAWRNLEAHERRCHECGRGGLCPLGRIIQRGWHELLEFAKAMRWLLRRAPAVNAHEQARDEELQGRLERDATEARS